MDLYIIIYMYLCFIFSNIKNNLNFSFENLLLIPRRLVWIKLRKVPINLMPLIPSYNFVYMFYINYNDS